jgi:type IV pilus assembly protein PilC
MPTYRYTVKKGPQQLLEGSLDAESRDAAILQLTNLGYTPVRVLQAPEAGTGPRLSFPGSNRVSRRHLNIFTRQFASLMRSGVPILRAMGILSEQTASRALRRLLAHLTEEVRQGQTLSEAMSKWPEVFSPLYRNLIRAGEVGGMLDVVLDRLSAQSQREEELRAKVQAAVAYPAFVAATGVATIVFLLTFVMPRLLKLFNSFHGQLPLPTRALIAATDALSKPWFWIGLGAAMFLLVMVWQAPGRALRRGCEYLALRLPVAGMLIRQLELSRFARAFGLLIDHGVPVMQAVSVSVTVVRHPVIRADLERMPGLLQQGSALADALRQVKEVNAFVVNTVAVGEEGGRAGEALAEIANFYEREADRTLAVAAALLEPAMILLVGALVGWIVMAVLLPVFELGSIV